MEELHSTEVLDREILEDARKKAYKILKSTEDTVKSAEASWKEKTGREIEALKKSYTEKIQRLNEEIMARLPLDERRLRSERTERLLHEQMTSFLGGLGHEKLKEILDGELRRLLKGCPEFDPRHAKVLCRGLGAEEAEVLLEKAIADLQKAGQSAALSQDELDKVLKKDQKKEKDEKKEARLKVNAADPVFTAEGRFPAILIDMPLARITASVDAAAEGILKERRAELAKALLGEGALND